MKLVIVVGTRPELIRLSCVINEAKKYFELTVVHTGQNYDKNLCDVFLKDLNIKIDIYELIVGATLGETMGNAISKSYELFAKIQPDCLLVLGDTNSALCTISAKRLKIPIFHMEAGNRCFDQNVPEEINRKIVDHISDINLPYTEHARKNLLSEGINSRYIFVTGSPMNEVIKKYFNDISSSKILEKFKIDEKKYFVLSMHREENVDNNKKLANLINSVNSVCEKYKIPVIFSVHPRTAKKLGSFKLNSLVKLTDPLGFFDYCKLQQNSFCVISDSGTISEECSLLNFPAVSIRDSTERPEGIDNGNLILAGDVDKRLLESIDIVTKLIHKATIIPTDYTCDNCSEKVIKIIQSYTPIINKFVWYKT